MNDELNPDFPVVTGDYLLTQGWRVQLPVPFNRRIEDGSLVLWRPDLTCWINIWHNDRQASVDTLLEEATRGLNAQRRDEQVGTHGPRAGKADLDIEGAMAAPLRPRVDAQLGDRDTVDR